jgi:hypothetical protein
MAEVLEFVRGYVDMTSSETSVETTPRSTRPSSVVEHVHNSQQQSAKAETPNLLQTPSGLRERVSVCNCNGYIFLYSSFSIISAVMSKEV